MAGVEGKGSTVIVGGRASKGEVEVINGRIKVKVVPRGSRREGYGSAQLKGGIASKGEVVIIAGAVKVSI